MPAAMHVGGSILEDVLLCMQEFLRSHGLALDHACAVVKQAQITRLADVNSARSSKLCKACMQAADPLLVAHIS